MERKNMVLLTVIAVATLLVAVVGATFAYFTATVQDTYSSSSDNGQADISSAKIAGTTIVGSVSSEAGSFTATDIYPGHKEIAALQVTAQGEAGTESAIAIKYTVTKNELYNAATISVYGLDQKLNIGEDTEGNTFFECQKKTEAAEGGELNTTLYYETCENNESKGLAAKDKIGTTQIIPQEAQQTLTFNDIITVEDESATKYYYVVIEFENDDDDKTGQTNQNTLMGKQLQGKITVEAA